MKPRALVLLLVVFVFADTRRQSVAPSAMYADARRAFDRGEIDLGLALAREGRLRFGGDLKWHELFTTVLAESLVRKRNVADAQAELDRMPHSGDPEATVRRLMAQGYVSSATAEVQYANAERLAARVAPELLAEIAVRRASPAFRRGDADAVENFAREALSRARWSVPARRS